MLTIARFAVDPDDGRVVAGLEADEQVRRRPRRQTREQILQLARRDLAGAAAAVGVLGEPVNRTRGRRR